MAPKFWNSDRDDLIRVCAEAGYSAQNCAHRIGSGCTRMMAVGRAGTLGVKFRGGKGGGGGVKKKPVVKEPIDLPEMSLRVPAKDAPAISATRPAVARQPLAPIFEHDASEILIRTEGAQRPPQAQERAIPVGVNEGKTIVDIGIGECRWPLGPVVDPPRSHIFPMRLFCAEPVKEGKPYCDAHHKRSFSPPRFRNIRTGDLKHERTQAPGPATRVHE